MAAVLASACGDDPVEPEATTITVSPALATLQSFAETVQLTATVQDQNGATMSNVTVIWTSRDEDVAKVAGTGLVTAAGNGTARVMGAVGTAVGMAVVTVDQRPVEIRVSPTADTLVALDDTLRLLAEAFDANGHAVANVEFSWASADESVATVDAGGLATATGNGTASVTAAIESVQATAQVTVDQKPADVRVLPAADTLVALEDTVRLSAEAFDANGHTVANVEFTWASADESVVAVDPSGLATAVGRGNASVTAVTGELSGSAAVTVEQRPFSVRVSPEVDTLVALDDTVRLSAEAFDANGHTVENAEFTWVSADESVITVDASGLATAVGRGNANVTAATGGLSGSAVVTVEQRPFAVSVSPEVDTLVALGDTVRLSAHALDANGHVVPDTEFTWESADTLVATADAAGLVTAVGNGTATVQASSGMAAGTAAIVVERRPVEVRVTPLADTLVALDDTLRLFAEALDANGHLIADAHLTWASDDTLVVSVDTTGLVTAVANGAAAVATTAGEASASAALTVAQRVAELRVSPKKGTLRVSDTLRLSAEAADANGHVVADAYFAWASGDDSVATVDAEGLVTGVGLGSAGVTVTEGSAGLEDTVSVLVVGEREVLVKFYEALGGGGWTNADNWGTDEALEKWYGVTADERGRVTALILGNNGLSGEIPAELGLLEHLRRLMLHNNQPTRKGEEPNQLTGSIPSELGSLESLEVLWLPNNELTGSIPPELGHLENLRSLLLFGNQLTGSIPPELGHLEDLSGLHLYDNQLTGSIPPELGSLKNLWQLSLYNNDLTGSIPPELGSLENLRQLSLYNNDLTGSIPPELGSLEKLVELELQANQLTGSIPPELGNLKNLTDLYLWGNELTGSMPPELGSLETLVKLRLRGNKLTGSIPSELGDLENLEWLFLSSNQLTGSIPSELGSLESLELLWLSGNELTGSIPSELGNLKNLTELLLWGNELTGSMPPELGSLETLVKLRLRGNKLTGSIPSELGDLENLEWLFLSSNQLTGSIPSELGSLESLELLWLSGNELTGSIPSELGNLKNLTDLLLWDNELTGSIPPELGSLESLERLGLSGNELTGSIPSELGSLESLELLGLWGNELTGSIPSELADLENLRGLYLGNNGLTGWIPRELGDLQDLRYLIIDHTSLVGPIPGDFTDIPLRQFHWHATDLCAPGDDEFQEWLDSIDDHRGGDTCADDSAMRWPSGGQGLGSLRRGSVLTRPLDAAGSTAR